MRRDDKQTALDAFIARKTEIDAMLERLKVLSDEHFGVSPDDPTGSRRHAFALRRSAQAHHRRGLQGGRTRRIAGRAQPRPARP